MEHNSGDQKVADLLSKLKNNQNAYPSDLLKLRRQKFLQQAAQAGLAMGTAAGLKNTLKGKGARLMRTPGTWLEVALVVAIVAEVSTAAYFYRHKLVNLLETFVTPTVQEVISVPVVTSSLPATEISVVPTTTLTETPTVTPVPSVTGDTITNNNSNSNTDNNNDASGGNNPSASTPAPNGNNGNHFGQTKQPPQATKEPKDTKVPKNK